MENVRWLRPELIVQIHNLQLVEHGGTAGIRDPGMLESALARPVNLNMHEQEISPAQLAAAYLFGIARNHPFIDGNKRVAYAAAESFLILNGYRVTADQLSKYEMVVKVASGMMTEDQIAEWFADNYVRRR